MSRLGIVALAFALATASFSNAARAAEGEDDAEGTPGAASTSIEAPQAANAAKTAKAARPGARKDNRRRKSKVVGFAVRDADLRAEPPPPPSGHIEMHVLASNEDLSVDIFNDDGSYDSDALKDLDHALRCKRTETEKSIDPRLFVLLSHVYDHFQKPLELVSGYRNQRRETSFHFRGSASDIRIEGVAPKKIREFAATLDAGGMGIGLYPRAHFVHIDVRPMPSYRWIDNARPNTNSPDKRPPRGWKRKKLQS